FANEKELVEAVNCLRNAEARREYLRVAQPEIWRSYSPGAVAKQFLAAVDRYSGAIGTGPGQRNLWQAICFRARLASERTGEQFPIARRVIARGLWALRNRSLKLLFRPSAQGLFAKKGPRDE